MKEINWNALIKPESEIRNIIQSIINKYADLAQMEQKNIIIFCKIMFSAGVEHQQSVIDLELMHKGTYNAIGNKFVDSMNDALKQAEILALASELPLLLECGKDCFNNGIYYCNDQLHDAVNSIMEEGTL